MTKWKKFSCYFFFQINIYISTHSLCHSTQNWAQMHRVSTDHLSEVSISFWVHCGKDCINAQIWERVQKHFCTPESPDNGSIISRCKKFEITGNFPGAGRPASLSNQGVSALVSENSMVTLIERLSKLFRSCAKCSGLMKQRLNSLGWMPRIST